MKIRIINPPTEITEKSRGPDIGMKALLDSIETIGWPDWLETGIPDLVPTDHIPYVWRWSDKTTLGLYYARNNVPWIAGQNIFFDDIQHDHLVPHIQEYEYELLHSKSLLGVITDGTAYQDVIRFACRNDIEVLQAPYPPGQRIKPESVYIDFLVYDKVQPINCSALAAVIKALPGTVEHVRYGDYTQAEYFRKLANAKSVIYLANHDRYPLAMVEALSAGCVIYGAERCSGPAIDLDAFSNGYVNIPEIFSPIKYPCNPTELQGLDLEICTMTDKQTISATASEWIDRFPGIFIQALTKLARRYSE